MNQQMWDNIFKHMDKMLEEKERLIFNWLDDDIIEEEDYENRK